MKAFFLLLSLLFLTGCSSSDIPETTAPIVETTLPFQTTSPEVTIAEREPIDPIEALLGNTSLEQRVGQLFLARCNDATALNDIGSYHLGGFVLFGVDFDGQTPDSIREKIAAYQAAASIPMLISVDEEGGTVNRISNNAAFRSSPFPSARESYAKGGLEQMLAVEEEKCQLLSSLGIQVNLGPVCDISTQPDAFMYQRSLGLEPQETANAIAATVRVMNAYKIGSVLKHFPGYGNNADTHTGIAVDARSLTQLEENDLKPFLSGFQAGADAVMVSHTIVQALDAEHPASLSPAVHDYIRNVMGYDGVIITDDLVMQAITDRYGAGEAAVMAVLAGNDLLCSTDYVTQYEAVLAAVREGRIDMDTLNRAVRRVLRWKQSLNLIIG